MAKQTKNSVEKSAKLLTSATDYASFIANLKEKIQSSQFKAALSVNQEMIRLYWDIGKSIVDKQEKDGWGTKVIERVAKDLQNEFPGIEGFSRTNIGRMRAFHLAYSIYPQAVGKLELAYFCRPLLSLTRGCSMLSGPIPV